MVNELAFTLRDVASEVVSEDCVATVACTSLELAKPAVMTVTLAST